MNKKRGGSGTSALRDMAETQFVADISAVSPALPADELLHKSQVHQIELGMQSGELQRALEESRNRYLDLYEFAPVGYLTLTDTGLITETNLTAATLLGLERKKLLQQRFDFFIHPEDRDRWSSIIHQPDTACRPGKS